MVSGKREEYLGKKYSANGRMGKSHEYFSSIYFVIFYLGRIKFSKGSWIHASTDEGNFIILSKVLKLSPCLKYWLKTILKFWFRKRLVPCLCYFILGVQRIFEFLVMMPLAKSVNSFVINLEIKGPVPNLFCTEIIKKIFLAIFPKYRMHMHMCHWVKFHFTDEIF